MRGSWATATRWLATGAAAFAAACDEDRTLLVVEGDPPSAPRELEAAYYAKGVDLSWRLGAGWDGEAFRVYGKRVQDPDYFRIAEVTSCAAGWCQYRDANVAAEHTYAYYVAAVDAVSGAEATTPRVEVFVPRPVPPPAPRHAAAAALDGAAYVFWDDAPSAESDFAAYRVYSATDEADLFLGETDSPGFMDLLAENGSTYTYRITSLDDQGHESGFSEPARATPRPDYAGEVVYAHRDSAAASGFRFRSTDDDEAVLSGDDPARHFRLEADDRALWLAPAPNVGIHTESRWTSALKCGPGADSDCVSWESAPTTGYSTARVAVETFHAYMFRVAGADGRTRYGTVRIGTAGADQDARELIVFDWAYQTQPGNPNLDPRSG